MWRLPSYKKATCCGNGHCYYCNKKEEPCWGQTTVSDEVYSEECPEDSYWIHTCEGHIQFESFKGQYIKSNKIEDQNIEPINDEY